MSFKCRTSKSFNIISIITTIFTKNKPCHILIFLPLLPPLKDINSKVYKIINPYEVLINLVANKKQSSNPVPKGTHQKHAEYLFYTWKFHRKQREFRIFPGIPELFNIEIAVRLLTIVFVSSPST